MNETTTCTQCKCTIYLSEGKKCEKDKCPIKIEPKKETFDIDHEISNDENTSSV